MTSSTPTTPQRPAHVGLALLALAIGGFAIGTTEFVSMGLLPQIADGVHISIPKAGHVISAYAIGVVVGAPTFAMVAARIPLRTQLVLLMVAFAVAHVASVLAGTYPQLLAARFLSGLPHGAYFGAASVVAASLVEARRRTWAVSMVLLGLTVANVLGVPFGTFLGQRIGWQAPYAFVGLLALVSAVLVRSVVPFRPADPHASARRELTALKRPQVWFALGTGTVGFGGMFATFSYITPTLTDLAGFSEGVVPILLVLYGIGMTLGTFFAGRMAQFGLMRAIIWSLVAIAVWLAVFGVLVQAKPTAVVAVLVLGFLPSVLVPMLQTRLMDVAHDGQSLAASLNHATLNIANALGAWLGGAVLAAGYGYEWPSRVGALLALAGLLVALASWATERRERAVGR